MRLPKLDARGSVVPYLTFWIAVVLLALVWIVFNEVVLRVGDWVAIGATEDPGSTWLILLMLYRMAPMIVILSTFVWAVVQSHRHAGAYPG